MSALTESPAWQALCTEAARLRDAHILDFFTEDSRRADEFGCEAAGLYLDYSRQPVARGTLEKLVQFAESRNLTGAIGRLLSGEPVNVTEGRPALHTALRRPGDKPLVIGGRNILPEVLGVLERIGRFSEAVRSGQWCGFRGNPVTDVVNIGIGGSDLGPRMVCEALRPYAGSLRLHFISNVDGAPLADLLAQLKPQSTLFIVTSKSFTTQETMANAQAARQWIVDAGGEKAVASHFVAVSASARRVVKFGIRTENTFEFWDWVGGRYSLWSAVGLPIALAIGAQRFRELLAGAHAMDEHFRTAGLARNLPVLMGLLCVWNTNFLGRTAHVVAPYAERLSRFVSWLQQLEMESNGKRTDLDGRPVDYATTPVLWGDVGSNAQHAFFQMLHQGPAVYPVDFILVSEADHGLLHQHNLLLANGLAQGAALLRGKGEARVREELAKMNLPGEALEAAVAHRVLPGNRPSNTLLIPRLDPYHLGALLALFEHRAYVLSVLWNINAFDQFGVELGKQAAERGLQALEGKEAAPARERRLDPSTRKLVQMIRTHRTPPSRPRRG
jgi:glucose-6-phosphate isomerase